jgi:hypothetical protein
LGLWLLASPLIAQQPAIGPEGGLLGLVTRPAVQAELKLSDRQKAELKAVCERGEQDRLRWLEQIGLVSRDDPTAAGGAIGGRCGADGDEPPPSLAQMVEGREEAQQALERSIARILSKEQSARAGQIRLQVEGAAALLRPEIQDRLFLSEEQVAEVRELMLERRLALRGTRAARRALRTPAPDRAAPGGSPRPGAPAGRGGGRASDRGAEIRKQMAALATQDERIEEQFNAALHSKILTRRQSRAYRAMLGRPFDPAGPRGETAGNGSGRGPSPEAKSPASSARGVKPGR